MNRYPYSTTSGKEELAVQHLTQIQVALLRGFRNAWVELGELFDGVVVLIHQVELFPDDLVQLLSIGCMSTIVVVNHCERIYPTMSGLRSRQVQVRCVHAMDKVRSKSVCMTRRIGLVYLRQDSDLGNPVKPRSYPVYLRLIVDLGRREPGRARPLDDRVVSLHGLDEDSGTALK